MTEEQTKEFEKGCAERGLCPRCLNMGEQNDDDIDLFGVCLNCGYSNPYNAAVTGSEKPEKGLNCEKG